MELRLEVSRPVPIMQTMVSSQTLPRTTLPDDYSRLLVQLKREIGAARTRAALAVNEELTSLLGIGGEILARQERDGWGQGHRKVRNRSAPSSRR